MATTTKRPATSTTKTKPSAVKSKTVASSKKKPANSRSSSGRSAATSSTLKSFEGLAAAEFNADGLLLNATSQYVTLYGLNSDDIRRYSFDQAVVDKSSSVALGNLLRSMELGCVSVEAERSTKQNERRWIRSQFIPTKMKGTRPLGFIELAQDVTAAKISAIDLQSQMAAIHNTQAVIEFTVDGVIVSANEIFLKTLGYSKEEIVGKHHRMFVESQAAKSAEYTQFWQNLRNGECQNGLFKRVAKDGSEVWIQAYYTPILDVNGKTTKVVKFASDATEQRKQAITRNMLQNMAASITFANAQNIITYVNPAAVRLLSKIEQHLPVRADQIVGQSIDIFHKNPNHQRNLVNDERNFPFEGTIRVAEESFTLKASRITDDEGRFAGTLVSWECVTDKLANERAVREGAERERIQSEELKNKVTVVLDNVNAMAQGNFDVVVPDLGTDSVGQVGQALNQAIRAINAALTEVRGVSTTVSAAATQLTSASRDISSGAQSQASSLEETASSLEEITSTVKQNSDNAQQADNLLLALETLPRRVAK